MAIKEQKKVVPLYSQLADQHLAHAYIENEKASLYAAIATGR